MDQLLDKINRHQLTVAQLKDELRARKAKVTGNKSELEDRLKFVLTTGQVVPGQKGKKPKVGSKAQPKIYPKAQPKIYPKAPIDRPLIFPKIPGEAPKIQVDKPIPTPYGPVTPPRKPSGGGFLNPHIDQILNLQINTIQHQLTVDQLKRELSALGLPVTGSKEELEKRLLEYLKVISVQEIVSWPTATVRLDESKDVDPGLVFDQLWEKTTEGVLQSLDPGQIVSFYDNERYSYHSFTIQEIKRTPFGLIEEIQLNPDGFSLIRYKNQWKLFSQAQAGRLDRARTFSVSMAAHLSIV